MAQAATMGPPLSPRETRRSGRRSAPSASASTSKSPDSPPPDSAPRTKDPSARPAPPNTGSNGRTKRPKQEDIDHPIPNKNAHSNGTAPVHAHSNGRSKRKGKEKEKPPAMDQLLEPVPSKHSSASAGTAEPQDDDVEEQGITRCICGMNGPSPVLPPTPAPHPSSSRQRTMPKAANSWCSAKYATFGNTVFAWASSRKPNSLQQPTTTVNSANQSVTKICSSVSLSLAPYRQPLDSTPL